MISYLNDKDFLKEICSKTNRAVSIKITSYNKNDEPIETIEGKVTQGSINIDGSSNTRRSCSLTIQTENLNIHDFYWSLTTRFQVELGIANTTNKYLNHTIIWFPMGYYLISSFSISLSTTGASVSIQGKDKMTKLNGDLGGKLTAETNFGVEDIIDEDNNLIHYNIPVKQIIKEMVHTYGQEDYSNIIINDVDDYGLSLQVYHGENPFWVVFPVNLLYRLGEATIEKGETEVYFGDINSEPLNLTAIKLNQISDEDLWHQESMYEENTAKIFYKDNVIPPSDEFELQEYYVKKISYGDTFGYLLTDLVYAGDLIAKAGENVTNVLDKIKTMLGDFEYFYDINGKFIFQKQKAYKSNGERYLSTDGDGIITDYNYQDIDLTFTNLSLITSLSNNVQINNLKNDFTVWGQKEGVSGGKIPIHMRYAIDQKPKEGYNSIKITEKDVEIFNKKYPNQSKGLQTCDSFLFELDNVNWRELIYQMALDYSKLHFSDEYKYLLNLYNNQFNDKTGYEQYYTDLLGFWRQLYSPYWNDLKLKNDPQASDLFLANTYYSFVEKEQANFYLTNNADLPDENDESNQYKFVNDKEEFVCTPKKYKYLYGPLTPTSDSATRVFYGNLENIIEQNYKILMFFYFSKYCQENNIESQINCDLYFYDSMTCVPEEDQDKELNIEFIRFKSGELEDCYHKVLPDGRVEGYWSWNNVQERTGKKIDNINLFNRNSEWYIKIPYKDNDGNEKNNFKSIGTYYAIRPNEIVDFSFQDYYNMAKLAARPMLVQFLKSLDPEAKIDIVKDFESYFINNYLNNKNNPLSSNQMYSLLALYFGGKSYYIPQLLSFLKDVQLNANNIQTVVESSKLYQDFAKQQMLDSFIISIFNDDGTNEEAIATICSNIQTSSSSIFTDLDEDLANKFSPLVEQFYNNNDIWKFLSRLIQTGLLLKIPSLADFRAELIDETVLSLQDYNLLQILFKEEYNNSLKLLREQKMEICNHVVEVIKQNAEKNQQVFIDTWYNTPEYKLFTSQVQYNFSEELLDDEYFKKEISEKVEGIEDTEKSNKIIQYQNFEDFVDEDNNLFIFCGYWDNALQKYKLIPTDTSKNYILQQAENSDNISEGFLAIIKRLQDQIILNFNDIELKDNQEDLNINLIQNIIKTVIGEDSDKNKIVTWDKDFNLTTYWHKDVDNAPDKLLFWFDFLDNPSSNLQKYSVRNIGQRAQVKNDNQVKVIKYLPALDMVLIDTSADNYTEEEKEKIKIFKDFHDGYQYINSERVTKKEEGLEYNGIDINNFSISANGKSAFVAIENLLYNQAYANENISISCIPQYFLEPNTKIAIYDDITKINGEYIISKISIPLNYNGLMSITATRAVDKFERSEIVNGK